MKATGINNSLHESLLSELDVVYELMNVASHEDASLLVSFDSFSRTFKTMTEILLT